MLSGDFMVITVTKVCAYCRKLPVREINLSKLLAELEITQAEVSVVIDTLVVAQG